jgi:hypothetical protein
MKKQFLLVSALAVFGWAQAQSPLIDWQKNYGGTQNDIAQDVIRTADGGYAVAGYTQSNNVDVVGAISGEDAWILKLNAAGVIEWKQIFGGSSDDRAHAIIQTANGDLVFAGTSNSTDGAIIGAKGGFDGWVVRLTSAGTLLWSSNVGGSDDDALFDLFEAPTGALIVAGESKSFIPGTTNRGGYDFYLVALRNTGSVIYQKQYGGSSDEGVRGVTRLANSIVMAGTTASDNGNVTGNKGGTDIWVVRTRTNGNPIFAQTYGGADAEEGFDITANASGELFVVGSSLSSNVDLPANFGNRDFFVLKLNASGTKLFSRNYGGLNDEVALSVAATADGGAAVAGFSESATGQVGANFGAQDFWFIELSGAGIIEEEINLGGSDNDAAYAVIPVGGSYVLAGSSESDDQDLTSNNGNADYWIVKLSFPAARLAADEVAPLSMTSFPNPAVDRLVVQADANLVQVEMYDAMGRMVLVQQATGNAQELNVAELPAGLYIITATTEAGVRMSNTVSIR